MLGNNVSFIGRLVRDIEIKDINGLKMAGFTLARNRTKASNTTENPVADFIDFVAFDKNAEFAAKWFKKGQRIGVSGRLSEKTNERDGVKYKTTNVIVESFEFIESSNNSVKKDNANEMDVSDNNKYEAITDAPISSDDDLPF